MSSGQPDLGYYHSWPWEALLKGTPELRSTEPDYWSWPPDASFLLPLPGVYLMKGQLDPKVDQMWSWPDVVSLLATRCLYQGVYLMKGQLDPKVDQMSRCLDVVSLLATRCLYQGVYLMKASLTQRLAKWQADLKCCTGGYIWLKCIWPQVYVTNVVTHMATRCLCLGRVRLTFVW